MFMEMTSQIGLPCTQCDIGKHNFCIAKGMVTEEYTLEMAEKQCYCLYTNHKDRIRKIKN